MQYIPVIVLYLLGLFIPDIRKAQQPDKETEPGGKYCCITIGERLSDAEGDYIAALNMGAELQRLHTDKKFTCDGLDTGTVQATIKANEVIFSLSKYSE